jgi:hypothetical protein
MRWRNHFIGAASILLLLVGSTSSAKAWYYGCNSYYYYGTCPDWYWSRGLLCPWSLCCGGYGGYGWGGYGYGGCGWGGDYGCGYGGWCLPNYSFCPNPPVNTVTMQTESELGGYQAVSYVRVLGARVGLVEGLR